MNPLLRAIKEQARRHPEQPAIRGAATALSKAELWRTVEAWARVLSRCGLRSLALYADNGPAWALADLAALRAGIRCVPLPAFFSDAQLLHVIADSGVDAVLAEGPRLAQLLPQAQREPCAADLGLDLLRLGAAAGAEVPAAACKITYTSGTTGTPKGVCLSLDDLLTVSMSLAEASGANADDRHLSLLPLPTLLENLAGLYVPLLVGATAVLLPQSAVGVSMSGADPGAMIAALHASKATTTVLVPQLLLALVAALERGAPRPSLRFAAVGGGAVSPRLILRARQLGLPVFEGYGLSECASVVSLNRPGADRPGSVGRPLPHAQLRIAHDGEIFVRGPHSLGYVGQTAGCVDEWQATGDLGALDAEGFLHLRGRRKSLFVTAFGRNVAPEWVESELGLQAGIAQAAVFGEARPWNVAVLVRRQGSTQDLASAVAAANQGLPEYARIAHWIVADEPFTPFNLQLTPNGRLRREQVLSRYRAALDGLYGAAGPLSLGIIEEQC